MPRRKKVNEFPFFPANNTLTTGTATGDAMSALAPSDGFIGRTVVAGSTNGTGTALIDFHWRTATGGSGVQISNTHKDASGVNYDLDAASGVFYTADGNGTPFAGGDTGGNTLTLRLLFDGGTATGAGSFRAVAFLVL